MTSSSNQLTAAMANKTTAGPWLGRLPLEIREVIYQYVLVEKIEHRMKSAEYNYNRDEILRGLDHKYTFNTAILRTNTSIHHEATNVFHRENLMVCLQLRLCDFTGGLFKNYGFQPLAKVENLDRLPRVAMTLTLGPHPLNGNLPYGFWEHENYIFASEDLPAVCTSLLRMKSKDYGDFRGNPLRITVDPEIGQGLRESKDGFPHPQVKLRMLLDPLRRLHGLDGVQVDGPGSAAYKDEVRAGISAPPDAKETMRETLVALSGGDKARGAGQLSLAIETYKAGLELSRGNSSDPLDEDAFWNPDPQAWGVTQRAIDDTTVRLQTRIAAAYLESRNLRMARIYAERVYGPHCDYDRRRRHRSKFPLQIEADRGPLFAKLLVVAAQISYANGHVKEALNELGNANKLDPNCTESQALYSQYEKRYEQLSKREAGRRRERARQAATRNMKLNGKIRTAIDRCQKADEAVRNENFMLARTKYAASLLAMEQMSKMTDGDHWFDVRNAELEGVSSNNPFEGFLLRQRSQLAEVSLKIGAYEDACRWAESAICTKPKWHSIHADWEYWAEPNYLKAHYRKGLALEHLGKLEEAISSMSTALRFDPGCGVIVSQLSRLENAQEARVRSREKQIRKKAARRTKVQLKKMKGPGFVIGADLL